MDKEMARRNIRAGIAMFVVVISLLGGAFIWAAVFLNAVK